MQCACHYSPLLKLSTELTIQYNAKFGPLLQCSWYLSTASLSSLDCHRRFGAYQKEKILFQYKPKFQVRVPFRVCLMTLNHTVILYLAPNVICPFVTVPFPSDMTPYTLVCRLYRFRGACCLFLQGMVLCLHGVTLRKIAVLRDPSVTGTMSQTY